MLYLWFAHLYLMTRVTFLPVFLTRIYSVPYPWFSTKVHKGFLLFVLIANRGNYLHLSIVVLCKTCINNLFSVNYHLIQIIKWMPPYWDNNALPHNFLILYFIFIENKCFSDVFWKGRKKLCQKVDLSRSRQNVKKHTFTISTTRTDHYSLSFVILTITIIHI